MLRGITQKSFAGKSASGTRKVSSRMYTKVSEAKKLRVLRMRMPLIRVGFINHGMGQPQQ